MDLNSTARLLGTIGIHYPSFKTHILDRAGNIERGVVEEWNRVIGFMAYEEALEKFDQYLKLPEGNKFAPDVKWFLANVKPSSARNVVSSGNNFDRIDRKGRLVDGEGRMYAFPHQPYEQYRYDTMGRIIDSSGRMVERR